MSSCLLFLIKLYCDYQFEDSCLWQTSHLNYHRRIFYRNYFTHSFFTSNSPKSSLFTPFSCPAALETLSAGKHDLAIVSETGTATTEFTVKGAAAGNTDRSAETGDELNILFFAVFAALAAAGVAGVVICGRRREHDM